MLQNESSKPVFPLIVGFFTYNRDLFRAKALKEASSCQLSIHTIGFFFFFELRGGGSLSNRPMAVLYRIL